MNISPSTYQNHVNLVNWSKAPEALVKGKDFFDRITKNGTDLESYRKSDALMRTVDLYLEKLSQFAEQQKPEERHKKAKDSRSSHKKSATKPTEVTPLKNKYRGFTLITSEISPDKYVTYGKDDTGTEISTESDDLVSSMEKAQPLIDNILRERNKAAAEAKSVNTAKSAHKSVVKSSKPAKLRTAKEKHKIISVRKAKAKVRKVATHVAKQVKKTQGEKIPVKVNRMSKELTILKSFAGMHGKTYLLSAIKSRHKAIASAMKKGLVTDHLPEIKSILVRLNKAITAMESAGASKVKISLEKGFQSKCIALVKNAKPKLQVNYLAGTKGQSAKDSIIQAIDNGDAIEYLNKFGGADVLDFMRKVDEFEIPITEKFLSKIGQSFADEMGDMTEDQEVELQQLIQKAKKRGAKLAKGKKQKAARK